jgi:hypothetical protein
MTSVLSPVLSESSPQGQSHDLELPEISALPKQDTREYLADMLKELSVIAAWAELDRARTLIDAALYEIEAKKDNQ